MVNGLVTVQARFPATPDREVVKLDVFKITDLVQGVGGWPWVDSAVDRALGVERVGLRFFALCFLPLFLSFLLALCALRLFILACQPVPVLLLEAVLLQLGVPGDHFAVIFPGPGLLHALRGFLDCEGSVPDVCIDHRLPEKIPVSAFEIWAYRPGGIFDDAWHG